MALKKQDLRDQNDVQGGKIELVPFTTYNMGPIPLFHPVYIIEIF